MGVVHGGLLGAACLLHTIHLRAPDLPRGRLNAFQQADLIHASHGGVDNIDATVQKLKDESPNAFHTNTTLLTRVFFHKPAGETPFRSFVRGLTQR
ncbi:MAG TPA: hypothetical protein VFE79_13750 [Paraburkholderia sp.]|nr:hypothetical protein [Paraburkholderia sp.]